MSIAESTIGDVAEFVNGMAFKPSHWESIGRRIIRIQNLNDSSKPYNRTTVPVEKKYIVEPGDLLVSWSASLGVFTWNEPDTAVLNQHIFRVRPDLTRVDKSYFRYVLDLALTRMSQFLHGSTMKHVNRNEFLGTKIPLPALEEQSRIAALLDKADAVLRKRQQAIALTEELLRSAFLEMFGDPVANPKGWEIVELEQICHRVTDGTHQPPKWATEGIPFLFVSNIVNGEIDFNVSKYINDKSWASLTARCPIEVNDILYTTVGSYGNAALVRTEKRFCFQRHIAHIKPNADKVHPEFLLGLMQSNEVKQQADRQVRGIAQKTLNLRELKKFQVAVPPRVYQDQYIAFRRKVEICLNNQQNSFKTQNALFNSLLQKAFRGEL